MGQNYTKTLTVEASGSAEQLGGCTSQLVLLVLVDSVAKEVGGSVTRLKFVKL